MDLSEAFGKVLKEHRLERNLSQRALGKLARIDQTTIGLIERNQRSPSLDTLETLAKALGLSPTKLISEAEKLR